jgi:hypothetical protein
MKAHTHIATTISCIAFLLISVLTFFPGWMSADSLAQYGEARLNQYGNWHPPLMAFWWHYLDKIYEGPALVLLQNLIFYWLSFYLLCRSFSAWLGGYCLLLPLFGLFPGIFFPLGEIWKDIACGTSLLLCWAILIHIYMFARQPRLFESLSLVVLCIYSVGVKPNAIVVIPFIAYSYVYITRFATRPIVMKVAFSITISLIILLISQSIVPRDKVIETFPFQYTQTYDLLGISVRTNTNQLPEYVNTQLGDDAKNLNKYYWVGSNNPLFYGAQVHIATNNIENIHALSSRWGGRYTNILWCIYPIGLSILLNW